MNLDTWQAGEVVLEKHAAVNVLLGKAQYTAADKTKILALLADLGLDTDDESPFLLLRRSRGSLLSRPSGGPVTITASGRGDWIGSVDLKLEQIRERPILNTARVMSDSAPDVLAVVEAESRPSLEMFADDIMPRVGAHRFDKVMLIDGNDTRGIDVGLMAVPGFTIDRMRSHVDDRNAAGKRIFSRDCPEFEVVTPSGQTVLVLVNHFKCKGYGSASSSNARRIEQATRVAAIYNQRKAEGVTHIAVAGDLNDTPTSAPLKPLLQATDLTDAFAHPQFNDGGHKGTYGSSTANNKIDYLLLSPALFAAVTAGGVNRTGMWPGVRPPKWPKLPEVLKESDVASDHALVWVDVAV